MGDAQATPKLVVHLTADELDMLVGAALERALARQRPPEPAPDRRRTLTVRQAAEELGAHPRTIRRMIADGRLRATRTGSGGSARVLVLQESLDELLGGGR